MAGINESKAKLVEYMAEFGREIVSRNGKRRIRGQEAYTVGVRAAPGDA